MSTKYIYIVVGEIKQNRFYISYKFIFSFLLFLAWPNLLICQTIHTYAGSPGAARYSGDGGPAIFAGLSYPVGTVSDKEGNLYIADGNSHVIRKVSASGVISTVAGVGTFGYSGDGGPATSARLWFPNSIALDTEGNLYILEYVNSVVRKVNKEGIISTIAGNGTNGYSGDGGPAILARLNGPTDLTLDKSGNLYIADKENKVVRKVTPSGIISTIAGNGLAGYTGDGGPATSAKLSAYAVATDKDGNLYIADGNDAVIRKVNTAGIISTFAGNGTYGYSGDGGPATSAQFSANSPNDIAFDNLGNLYVADYENQVIRKVNTEGIISTVAGIANQSGYSGDSGPATAAKLWFPTGISVDSCNNLYITDSYNNRIRKVSFDEDATVIAGPADISVCGNSKTSFGIRAGNTSNFQWMINKGAGWNNVTDNETYSGTNTDTLQISKAITSMDKYQYLCRVSNACGPVYSKIATLSVIPAMLPSISITASDTSICKGSTVIFTAEATQAETNAVYQWKKDGVAVGTNKPSYSDSSLKDGAVITCTLTSTNSCQATDAVISNSIAIRVETVATPAVTISASSDTICQNASVTFLASAVNAGSNAVFQWKRNGENVGTNDPSFTSDQFYAGGDVITCTLISNQVCTPGAEISSNPITILVRNDTIPKVRILASSDTICAGTSITFTALNESKNHAPTYQWLVNGSKVGSDSPVFITSHLTGNPFVQCIMTVPQCTGSAEAYSNSVNIIVNPAIAPSVTIRTASPDTICKGTAVTFIATPAEAGTNPFYQWQINDHHVGTNNDHFTVSDLNDGDIVTCVLTADSSLRCLLNQMVSSNSITVNIKTPLPIPVTITPSANDICGSAPITFTAGEQPGGPERSCFWLLNGQPAGTDSHAYTLSAPANHDQVKLVVITSIPGCSSVITDISNTIAVSIKPIPRILLSPLDTTVMTGTQVQLSSTVTGDIASFSWTPENALTTTQTLAPLTIPVETSTKYKLHVVATNGCSASAESSIKVIQKLYLPNAFSPNGDGINDVFSIPAGTSINLKELSIYNRWGTKIFTTNDINKGWDGRIKGAIAEIGLYIFIVKATDYQNRDIHTKGSVFLIR